MTAAPQLFCWLRPPATRLVLVSVELPRTHDELHFILACLKNVRTLCSKQTTRSALTCWSCTHRAKHELYQHLSFPMKPKIAGAIPQTVLQLPALRNLNLKRNNLKGELAPMQCLSGRFFYRKGSAMICFSFLSIEAEPLFDSGDVRVR